MHTQTLKDTFKSFSAGRLPYEGFYPKKQTKIKKEPISHHTDVPDFRKTLRV